MLKIGLQDVTGLYVGETKIEKAYLGGDLVFSAAKKPSRLPEGYTEVEYIQNADASSYIDTKKFLYSNSIYALTFLIPTLQARYVVSSSNGRYSLKVYSASKGTLQIYTHNGTSGAYKTLSPAISANQKVTIEGDGTALYVNGVENTLSYKPYTQNIQIPTATASQSMIVRYYHFKAECPSLTSTNYNFELIPCINPSGIVGFYDLTNGAFTPPTAGNFVAGPAV